MGWRVEGCSEWFLGLSVGDCRVMARSCACEGPLKLILEVHMGDCG